MDYACYPEQPAEILLYGGNVGIGTPPLLQSIRETVSTTETPGWDGRSYAEWAAAFDRFLSEKGFRDAFATTDDLCRSLGAVVTYCQGRLIENIRMGNAVDGYVITGWEGNKVGNHAGLVDVYRHSKANTEILAAYNRPLYIAVKCHDKVVAVDEEIAVDLHLVNEEDVKGELTLQLTAEDERGLYIDKHWPVQASGGTTYGELLVRDVSMLARTPGYTRIDAVLRRGKKQIATGRERIFAVAYDPNSLPDAVAVMDPNNEVQALLREAGIAFVEHEGGYPEGGCLVVGAGVSAGLAQGDARIGDAILDWVTDGLTLVVTKQADIWAEFLALREVVDYRGHALLRTGDYGGNYFVRQHPLFADLPANTAFNWEYQCLDQQADRRRFGLRLRGEQCVVGCYTGHQPEPLTAVGIVPLGRGRILLSTLDLEAAVQSRARSAIIAKQILLNYLRFATATR
jgi:hypothetical protein